MADGGRDEEPRRSKLAKRVAKAAGKGAASGAAAGLSTGTATGVAFAAGVGMLGGSAGELVGAAVERFKGATARLEEAAEFEKARELEAQREDLTARLAHLREHLEDERDLVSNVRAILQAWSHSWDMAPTPRSAA